MADPRYRNGVYVGLDYKVRARKLQLQQLQRSSLPANGWTVTDSRGSDPFVVSLMAQEGAPGPIYRLDVAGETAWAYVSHKLERVVVATTVNDEVNGYEGSFIDLTRDVVKTLTARELITKETDDDAV